MGKWAKLKGKVPKFEQPPEFAVKVDEAKKIYIGLDTAELAREYARQRAEKQNIQKQESEINIYMEALSQILISHLEGSSMDKVHLVTGETGYIQDEPYSAVEDKIKLMEWIKKKKLQKLLTLNWQTQQSLVKDVLSEGKPMIPGIKVYLKTSFRLRGATGAAAEDEANGNV